MADFELLKKQRKILKQAFTRIVNFCNQQNVTSSEVAVRAERADELFSKYEDIQSQIDDIVPTEQMAAEEQYRQQIEAAYFRIKAMHNDLQQNNTAAVEPPSPMLGNSELTQAIQVLTQNQSSMGAILERFAANVRVENASTPNISNEHQTELQLPKIQIPDFDGNFLEWIRFKELFEALVHNRSNLANIQKLEYLQSKVKGEALIIIKHLRPTNDNYQVAWDLLNNKYNNTERIKNSYMELIFDQPNMKTASLEETKRLYNNINEGFNAVKALDSTTTQWSTIVLFHMEKKLDSNTAMLWYRDKSQGNVTFETFLKFLEKRIFELESIQASHQSLSTQPQTRRNQSRTYTATVRSCPICGKQHKIFHCEVFKKMNVNQRRVVVQKHGLCFNCLNDNHRANNCKSSLCKKCNKKHNSMLHISNDQEADEGARAITDVSYTQENNDQTTCISNNTTRQKQQNLVILPTALITIIDVSGSERQCRALLDSGSQGTLITEECVQRMRLKKQYDKTLIFGLASNNGNKTRGKVKLEIKADNKIITTEALCLSNLTQILPSVEINHEHLTYFKNLNMADPNWNKPSAIDIILGADVFMDCLLSQQIIHPSGSPVALNSIFGWVIMGRVHSQQSNNIVSNHVRVDLDQQLQRFWECEEVPDTSKKLSPEEEQAEQHYMDTVQRDNSGRYVVRMPLKNNKIEIGESKQNAMKRLLTMERKFKKDEEVANAYKAFMREYIQLNHMEPIHESTKAEICYLPHHSVVKPTSTTTKLRVVFDASNKTTNGKSLNDNLLVGPKVQRDLFDMLVSFRIHSIAVTGDIEKMYRQVLMHTDDRSLQCILWREQECDEVTAYRLNTVTYGTAAASFLATRTLKQVSNDVRDMYPIAAEIIDQNFYVDDLMCSMPNLQLASKSIEELRMILSGAGFNIRKWSTNSEGLLNVIRNNSNLTSSYEIQCATTSSTLGLVWETTSDYIMYNANKVASEPSVLTKRMVLANLSKIYDPMGWLAPIIVGMKIYMQELWLKGVSWDEPLPSNLAEQWIKFNKDIAAIGDIKIPRWIQYTPESNIELHGFSDASERAYAAAVYVKVYCNNQIHSHLIAAKSRVSPIKQISLPRLELCGAHLLTKLLVKVRNSLNLPNIVMHGWTDSTIVLAWLSDHPCRWKTFVANRTSQIINIVPAQQWHHIQGQRNPADLATRISDVEGLSDNKLWWNGPDELSEQTTTISNHHKIHADTHLEERKEVVNNVACIDKGNFMLQYSSFTKLVRITALILRFINNCKGAKHKRIGFITTTELRTAHDKIIKVNQQMYHKEYKIISSGSMLPNSHPLASVTPFIDNAGLLRVGGRIANANISFDQKHPLILHKQSHITKIIIWYYHVQHFHAGRRLLYYLLHLKYWIPSASQAIRNCIYKCVSCMRQRAQPYKQQMGQMPGHRLNPAPPFSRVAVDFAGPVQIRAWRGRGAKTYKCWIVVFVCLSTKAMHIDLCTELSSAAFIASFRRFVSRRGKPSHVYSDNGTNFVGANQHLKDLYDFLNNDKTQEDIHNILAENQLQWHFSPPGGPHFGGLWEAGVKSVKYHLKRVLKDAHPTYEEMYTILCQIESCINSRPLCLKFEDDPDPLTPAHFLILRPLTTLPDENFTTIKENLLARWEYIQRLVQQFWQKWSLEYLHQLQQSSKWKQKAENIKINDIVVIKDDNLAPSHWSLGRVIELHPGKDGLIRVVTIKTSKGQVKRPIVKLCPLFKEQ